MTSIKERISKLLALSESANEHEAAAAFAKARALMVEYQLSEDDIAKSNPGIKQDVVSTSVENWPGTTKRGLWEDNLAMIVADAFSTRITTRNDRIFFHGIQEDAFIAAAAYHQLRNRIMAMAAKATANHTEEIKRLYGLESIRGISGVNHPKTWRQSYVLGVLSGLRVKLAEEKKKDVGEVTALVLRRDTAVRVWIDENLKTRTRDISTTYGNSSAYSMGREDGRKMGIRPEVGTTKKGYIE